MTNIAAIIDLFPSLSRPSPPSTAEHEGEVIRGAYPYAFLKENLEYANPLLMKVLGEIELDAKWGPLFRGDLTAYEEDHSRADLALCREFLRRGLSAQLTDLAMRASVLYREKWERDDYRSNTILKAQSSLSKGVLEPAEATKPSLLDLSRARLSISSATPPPRDWFYSGILVPGKSAILAGFGGSSKTQFAIQLAISAALGRLFAGRLVKQGSVMLICGEEDRAELTRRVNAVVRFEQLTSSQIATVEARVHAFPLDGEDIRLTRREKFGEIVPTGFGRSIIEAAGNILDLRLIVVDHVALLHGGEFNAKEDVTLTMRVINKIAKETGAAVLVLAHAPKSGINQDESDANMVAGSTAFVDQARAALVLSTMRKNEATAFKIAPEQRRNYVSLKVVKSNYGPSEEVFWFKRQSFDDVGLLEYIQLVPLSKASNAADLLSKAIEGMISAEPGTYSRTAFRDRYSGTGGTLAASKAIVEVAISNLLKTGKIVSRPPTDAERRDHDLGGQVKAVLDVGK